MSEKPFFSKKVIEAYMERKIPLLPRYIELKRETDILYDVLDVRMRTVSRLRGLPKEVEGLYVPRLLDLEKELTKQIKKLLKVLPESEVFNGIRGMGPRLTASWVAPIMVRYKLVKPKDLEEYSEDQQQYKIKAKGGFRIPEIRGIVAFATVSDMWSWCGLSVVDGHAPTRRRGVHIGHSPAMRMLTWKTRGQFVRQGDFYRKSYETHKSWLSERSRYAVALQDPKFCPRYGGCMERLGGAAKRLGRAVKKPPCKGHIDSMARIRMIKGFVRDFYVRWLQLEDLPVPPAYDPDHRHHD